MCYGAFHIRFLIERTSDSARLAVTIILHWALPSRPTRLTLSLPSGFTQKKLKLVKLIHDTFHVRKKPRKCHYKTRSWKQNDEECRFS
jgi:hypothetical protein